MENVSSRCGKRNNAPRLRFPEFRGEWVEKKIKEFANCYAGATPSTKERKYWENGTIPWLSSGEVNKKHISFTDNFITKIGYDSCSTKMIPANTVVMALAGQGKTRGTVAITEIELCTNQSLASIVTNETVDDKFLLYYLETQYSNLRAISSGDGTRGGLNLNIINEYSVFLASLPEQKKIAAFFTLLDRRIQKQRQFVEYLKTYKRGVIFSIFKKDNQFGIQIKKTPLSELLTEYRNRNTKNLMVCSVAVGKGVVNQIEHLGRSFAAADTSNYGKVKPGDIVYTKSPTGNFPYGIVKQSRQKQDVAVSPLYGVYTPKSFSVGTLIHNYFEQRENANNYIRPLAQKGAKNTINITTSYFLQGIIPFPKLEDDIEKLANFFNLLDEKIQQTENFLHNLSMQKKELLHRMFI